MTLTQLRLAATAGLLIAATILTACDKTPDTYANYRVSSSSAAPAAMIHASMADHPNREQYPAFETSRFRRADEAPVSTFSVDVDTAAYSNVRRMLVAGQLPPHEAVRVEEMINYFDYAYPTPADPSVPFATSVAVVPAPWSEHKLLLHVGIKGYETAPEQRPRANLVLLIDVSGSMSGQGRLELVKQSFRLMLNRLDDQDSVAIVTYAGRSAVVLEPTPAHQRAKILRVRPETLCRITEFSEHESNGRELDEGERVAVEVLPVLGQSAAAVEPGDGAFDHPTPGLDDEALHPVGSLDDLGLEIGQDAGQGAVKDRALIGAVGEQFPEKGKQTEQGRRQRETAVAILNVGGGDDAVQQQALRIDQNMPLLALDQLAGIEAVAVDASPPFSALFTL